MRWYFQVLKKYFGFSGRARRREYWTFTLINVVVIVLLAIVDNVMGTIPPGAEFGGLTAAYYVATLLPALAVLVRRLHDANHSGWWGLLALTGIGVFALLAFALQDSYAADNRYGPNPKPARTATASGLETPPPVPVAFPARVVEFCPSCGAASDGAKFCRQCGASLSRGSACPGCGAALDPDSRFCAECGTSVSGTIQIPANPATPSVTRRR